MTDPEGKTTLDHLAEIAEAADPFVQLWEELQQRLPQPTSEEMLQKLHAPVSLLKLSHLKALHDAIKKVADRV